MLYILLGKVRTLLEWADAPLSKKWGVGWTGWMEGLDGWMDGWMD